MLFQHKIEISGVDHRLTELMGDMKILLVEDEVDVAHYEKVALELGGHQVDVIHNNFMRLINGQFDWSEYDVLVCDFMLPEVSGATIIDYVRTNFPNLRRVLVTAASPWLDDETKNKAHLVLSKPFHAAKLLEAVKYL